LVSALPTNQVYLQAVAVLKRLPVMIDFDLLSEQLQLFQLPQPTQSKETFEALYSMVHHALSPFLDQCMSVQQKNESAVKGHQGCFSFKYL
jgi:hypothetical protein